MADPVRYTVDQVFARMRDAQAGIERERAQISMNNQHLIDMKARAYTIADPTTRATMIAWIDRSARRQSEIAGYWRATNARVSSAVRKLSDWLVSIGIRPSSGGLADVGAVPLLVPAIIAGVVLLAWAAVAYVHEKNKPQILAINYHQRALDAAIKQGATPAQIAALVAEADRATRAAAPRDPDPLGLQGIAGSVATIAVSVAGLLLLREWLASRKRGAQRQPREALT